MCIYFMSFRDNKSNSIASKFEVSDIILNYWSPFSGFVILVSIQGMDRIVSWLGETIPATTPFFLYNQEGQIICRNLKEDGHAWFDAAMALKSADIEHSPLASIFGACARHDGNDMHRPGPVELRRVGRTDVVVDDAQRNAVHGDVSL